MKKLILLISILPLVSFANPIFPPASCQVLRHQPMPYVLPSFSNDASLSTLSYSISGLKQVPTITYVEIDSSGVGYIAYWTATAATTNGQCAQGSIYQTVGSGYKDIGSTYLSNCGTTVAGSYYTFSATYNNSYSNSNPDNLSDSGTVTFICNADSGA